MPFLDIKRTVCQSFLIADCSVIMIDDMARHVAIHMRSLPPSYLPSLKTSVQHDI